MVKNIGIFFRHQVTPYVILFIERDGSTYLTSLLMSHPDINAVYERFSVLKQKGATVKEQLEWADKFLTPPFIGRKAVVGFKTKLVDVLDLEGFSRLLQKKNAHILQMQRRNRIKAVVSRINARRLYEASGKWNLYQESDRMPPMTVDPDEFARFLKEREQADQDLESFAVQLGLPRLKLIYEDLLRDRDAVLNTVFAFLKVRPKPVQGSTLKHTKDNLREVVINFDDLRSRYVGTPYEEMFDEVLV
jgi:LPS sulfotransferase NodH